LGAILLSFFVVFLVLGKIVEVKTLCGLMSDV